MKLSADLLRQVNDKLVLRANELYHDGEGAIYDARNEYWQPAAVNFFASLAASYLAVDGPVCCLDYGSGTGFVPLAIGPHLKPEDTLICVDLSHELLNACRSKIATAAFPFQTRFLKTDGKSIPVDDQSVDVVTVNSVLHHLHDLRPFAAECRRILRDGGVLIVAYEPNGDRHLPPVAKLMFALATVLLNASSLVYWLVDRSAFLERALRGVLSRFSDAWKRRNTMLHEIGLRLYQEKLVDRKLRGVEIQQLVDYHTQFGFSRQRLLNEIFHGFCVEEWKLYNYLGGVTCNNFLSRSFAKLMEKQWPTAGCTMAFVLRKGKRRLPPSEKRTRGNETLPIRSA